MNNPEFRPYTRVRDLRPAMGRSQEEVLCPFCLTWVDTFIWSRFGSGKLCDCGALLGGIGAYKEMDP